MPQEKQTTAVSQLIELIEKHDKHFSYFFKAEIEKAKEIERQQIEDAKIELYLFKGYDLEDSKKMASDYFESTFTQQQ